MIYFRIACVVLILISVSHLTGHFVIYPRLQLTNQLSDHFPSNKTEETLLQLMNEYHKQIGGKSLSFMDIQNGLSLCYALFFFWLGFVNLMIAKGLTRNRRMLSHICLFNSAMLLTGMVISFVYFFWLPFVSFLAALVFFVIAAFKLQKDF